jgi:Uma2 family endonuclease
VGRDRHAAEPRIVIEVLSPSTRAEDAGPKLSEYQSVPTIQAIIHLESDQALARTWWRGIGGQWESEIATGQNAILHFRGLGIDLRLAEIHEDVVDQPGR